MKTHQAHVCFNEYKVTNAHFGCGVVKFNTNEIEEFQSFVSALAYSLFITRNGANSAKPENNSTKRRTEVNTTIMRQ